MSIVTSQILKSADFTKTQKFRYLENKRVFFLQMKEFIKGYFIKGYFTAKNSFVAEATFKGLVFILLFSATSVLQIQH